jgi:hypothetical protein
MKMTRKEWRTLAREVQQLAKNGEPVNATLLLRRRLGTDLIGPIWNAVKQLRDLPDIKS